MIDWAQAKDTLMRRNTLIVRIKRAHPDWNATKVAEHVAETGDVYCPVRSVGQVWRGYERAKMFQPDSALVKNLEGPTYSDIADQVAAEAPNA